MLRTEILLIGLLITFQLNAQDLMNDSCKHMTPEEFYLGINSSVLPLLIDVRTGEEFSRERIPGALNVETRAGLELMADSLDPDRPLFLYCENDQRSPVACHVLCDRSFRNVYNLKGGLVEWRKSTFELDRKKIRKNRTTL